MSGNKGYAVRLTLTKAVLADRWQGNPNRHQSNRAWRVAAGAAVLTHAALLAVITRTDHGPLLREPEQAGFPLLIEQLEPLAEFALSQPPPPATTLTPPASVTVATGHAAPSALARAFPMPPPSMAARTLSSPRAALAAGPVPTGQAAIQAVPPAADGGALVPALEARIDDAVRDAATMPDAARRQHRQGRARVGFTYVDGRVDRVRLVASSESRTLDDAAVHAVSLARYPAPPAPLRGRRLDLLVWVDFRIDA